MILKNPLMYVTLPLALAFGLIWFRRKKLHCDTGGKKSNNNKSNNTNNISDKANNTKENGIRPDLKHSVSMPIGTSPNKQSSSLNNNDSFDFKFGRSAPIDITPNKTSPTRSKSNDKHPVDADVLKSKIQDVEYKTLNSIEEHSFDSVDLPDSVGCRRRFSFTNTVKSNEPAVVVKASTMSTNRSPQSSFGEVPVTELPAEERNDVKANKKSDDTEISAKLNNLHLNEKQTLEVNTTSVEQPASGTPTRNLPVASPPLSLCSNKSNQSNDSGDSGKGSSPPNSEGGQSISATISYDFELGQSYIGYVVGKGGATVQLIKSKTGASILIRRHPESKKLKWCTLQGTKKQVDAALAIIKAKLPARVNIKRVDFDIDSTNALVIPTSTISSSLLQLHLVDGINNDVIISTVINGGHLFLQQPLHPSYPSLNVLQSCMNQSYSSFESPLLPNYNIDTICVGLIDGHWYRLQIVEHIPDNSLCLAKYLDYGGYCNVQTTDLRQIRTDFMTIPFQAIECLLADIKPKGGDWSEEATKVIIELSQYRTLQAQIAGYSETGLPEILLYSYLGPNNIVFINQELVARNYAEWCDNSNLTEA